MPATRSEVQVMTDAQWRRGALIAAAVATALYAVAIAIALLPKAQRGMAQHVVFVETLFFFPLVVPAFALAMVNRAPRLAAGLAAITLFIFFTASAVLLY